MKITTFLLYVTCMAACQIQFIAATKGKKREREPIEEPSAPARKAKRKSPSHPPPRPYTGLSPPEPPQPTPEETGFYNLPPNFWFNPIQTDAVTLAEVTMDSITQAFYSYPQDRIATRRIGEQLERHQHAWNNGIHGRYTPESNRVDNAMPDFSTWNEAHQWLEGLWTEQYYANLRRFLTWYRDYLLQLLASFFDSFGLPRRDHHDDDPSGLPYHPGPGRSAS